MKEISFHTNFLEDLERRIFPKSFNEASIVPIPKPNKILLEKKTLRPMSLINRDTKVINKFLAHQLVIKWFT
jgi:hypothetical protein